MKKFTLFLSAILISAMSFAAALGEGYSKVTDITTLAAGDKVVVYCDDASLGVTGWNDNKDATVAAEGWVEYVVEAAEGGVLLKDGDNYIALTAKNGFYYNATGSVCKVNAAGVLYCTLNDVDYFLYENGGNYYRMYADKTGNSAYKPFYVYEVVVAEPEPEPEPVDPVKPEPVYTENILNPFAFNLSSELSADAATLTINYTLNNSKATAVDVVVYDGETAVKTVAGTTTIGKNTVAVATSELPKGKQLTWKVVVKGTSVEVPTQETKTFNFWGPRGLAIDNNPESENFGRILVTESYHATKDLSNYLASGKGAGIYTFNPSFTTDSVVYNGGIDFTRKLTGSGFQPWRVKISEDGRIFASSCDINGVAVWEVSKDLKTWTPVIAGTNDATDYNIYDADSNFVAGVNVSMDVIGSGENLKLLLYSANNKGIVGFNQGGFRLDEYALGTATTFTGTPKNIVNGGKYGMVHTDVDFVYDGEGGYWFGGSRAGKTGEPNLIHINAAGEQDYYSEDAGFYGGAGILIHNGMLFKGKTRTSSSVGNFGIYTIGKDTTTGKVTLTEKWAVQSKGLGRNHNVFAVDYAENLYVIGNSGEMMIAYALPYNGEVTTPAAAKYAFELEAPATSVEMVGVVKRALQLGETTIVLTHEADGTPHIYTIAGEAIAEVSQEGIVAKDPDNAGDYLTISDIALTEDGKLVACNYVRTQFDASYIESGYKRGTLHLYVWNDIKGAASIWFESMFTANSLRGDCGYTMAVNGTVANANILVTAVHNSHRGVRMSHYSVVDGAYVEPNYASGIYDNHLFYVGAKFKGASAGDDAATFNEATHGVNFQLNASPLAESNWVMDSEGLMPTEFGVASQQDPSIVGAVAETLVSKTLVGAYYVTVGDKKVMVAPYADAEGKLAGVKLLDITAGFANAALLTTAESLDLTAPVAATGVATTAVVESNGTLTINLIADATIHTMTATIQESPSTNLENNNVQNDIIKFYQNGQIYIMINGAVYNVMGQMVK